MPSTDPSTVSGYLSAYLADPDTIVGADGSTVESMTAGAYAKPSGWAGPTLRAAPAALLNGHQTLRFATGQALLAAPPAASPNPNFSGGSYPTGFSAFAVVKPNSLANLGSGHPNDRRTFVGWRSTVETSGDNAWSIAQSGKIFVNFQHHSTSGHWGSDGAQGLSTFSTGNWHVVGIRTDGQTLTCWKGLGFDKTDTNTLFGSGYSQFLNGFCLGGDRARPGNRDWDGEIAYFVPFSRAVSDGEAAGIAQWLLERFGLPLRSIDVDAFTGTTGHDVFLRFVRTDTGKPAHLSATTDPGPVAVRVNGGTPVEITPLSRRYGDNEERSSLIALRMPTPIQAGDAVDVTFGPGVVPTIVGPVEEVAQLAATNHVGAASILSQDPPEDRTMVLGWNYNHQGAYYTTGTGYKNLFKTASVINEHTLTLDADFNVVNAPQGTTYLVRTGSEDATTGPGLNGDYPGAEFGRYVVQWDGPAGSLLELAAYAYDQGQTVITHVPELDDLAGTTKRRYYDVTPSPTMTRHRPNFSLRHASSGHTCVNIVVQLARYEGTSGYFVDQVVERLADCDSIRFMDAIQTNFSNIGNVAELTPLTDATWNRVKTRTIPISRIESYEGTHYSPDTNIQHWKVTFAEPHGLTDGQGFTIRSTNGEPVTVTLVTGARDLRHVGGGGNVLSSTEFYFAEWVGGGTSHATTSTPFTGGNAVGLVEVTGGMPVEMLAHLVNETGAGACHVCVPHPASDACAAHMADVLAATLDAGKMVRVELSNEPWNLGFSQWSHYRNESVKRGLVAWPNQSTAEGYIARAVEVLDIFAAQWAAADRPADEVEFIVGSWNIDVSFTSRMATWLAANRPELRCRWSFAPYFYPMALGRLPGVDHSEWSLERMMDYHEAWALAFNPCEYLDDHAAVLDGLGIDYELNAYENQNAYLGISPAIEGAATLSDRWVNWNREALAIYFHPRMRGITFKQLEVAQSEGIACNMVYGYNNNLAYEFANFGLSIYGDFLGLDAPHGKGDGSDGKPDNRPHLIDGQGRPAWVPHLNLTSVRGGAKLDWQNGVPEPPDPPPSGVPARFGLLRRRLARLVRA